MSSDGHLAEAFPLSAEQENLLVLGQFGAEPCHVQLLTRMETDDLAGLLAATEQLLGEKEMLRAELSADCTSLVVSEFSHFQIDHLSVPSTKEDVLDAGRRQMTPGITTALVAPCKGETGSWLLLTVPPLLADRRSVGVLAAQISDLMNSSKVVPSDISYFDYALWQKELVDTDDFTEASRYWDSLIADVSLPVRAWIEPAGVSFAIDAALRRRVAEIEARWGISTEAVLLVTWLTLLCRFGQTSFGIVTTGVSDVRLAVMLGPLAHTLPVSTEIDDAISVAAMCRLLADELEERRAYEAFLPLTKASTWRPDCVLDYLSEADGPTFEFADECTDLHGASLRLLLRESSGCLKGRLLFRTDLWKVGEAATVSELFVTQLAAVCENFDSEVGALRCADSRAARTIDAVLCGPARPTIPTNVPTRLAKVFRDCRDEPAIVDGAQRLSYRDLDERSGRVAAALCRRAGEARRPIGICMPRSADLLCAIIGVLRAGLAFVPLDPEHPAARLKSIARSVGLEMVIDDGRWERSAQGAVALDILIEEALSPATWKDIADRDLAYIMHTSGSTGSPKGVRITHANLAHYLDWAVASLFADQPAAMPLLTSPAFDLTITSIFCPLLTGGCVHVYRGDDVAANLREAIDQPALNAIKLTPGHIDLLPQLSCRTTEINVAIIGGEALHRHQVDELHRLNPQMRIVNEYGPTEATVGCIAHDVDVATVDVVPIGRPIAGMGAALVNQHLMPVAWGEIGEIIVWGSGIADGYLDRHAETAERFIHRSNTDAYSYRTGDLARLNLAGDLEYIGRTDSQLKVSGYRVELGEIEGTLRRIQGVGAAVVLKLSEAGADHLIAFVTPIDLNLDQLDVELRQQLPYYMIPERIVPLAELPLNSNGKIDRVSLTAQAAQPLADIPATTEDALLATVIASWSVIFGRTVGPDAGFFALGGDSIKAIRLISHLNQKAGARLTIKDLYTCRTPRNLANQIDSASLPVPSLAAKEVSLKFSPGYEAISTAEIEDVLPAAAASVGMIFESLRNPGIYHVQNVYDFELPGFDIDIFRASLKDLAQRHEALRSTFDLTGLPDPVQIIWRDASVPVRAHNLSGLTPDEQKAAVADHVAADLKSPFLGTERSLWRATLLTLGQKRQVLLWSHHHAILDGWSNTSAMSELGAIYRRRANGNNKTLPPLRARQIDHIVDQMNVRADPAAHEYWRSELSDYKRLTLFDDTVQCEPLVVQRSLGAPRLSRATDLANRLGTDLKALMLAMYGTALSHFDYDKDFIVGVVENNRPLVDDGDRMLGCFLNSVPLRFRWDKAPRMCDVVEQCRNKLAEMKYFGRLPLADITAAARGESQASAPIFDTIFNFVDFSGAGSDLSAGAEQSDLSFERTDTLLDCTVSITDGEFISRLVSQGGASPAAVEHIADSLVATLDLILEDETAEIPTAASVDASRISRISGSSAAIMANSADALFARTASAQPEAIALIDGDLTVRYGELDAAANRLAWYLSGRGVRRGDIVGLHIDKSADYVMAMLGVLMAGGAFLPLPREYPTSRLKAMIDDADAAYVITQDSITFQSAVPVISLAEQGLSCRDPSPMQTLLQATTEALDLAYVMYTSGSTGLPKGVPILHGGLVNLAQAEVDLFELSPNSRSLLFASLGFDVSIAEIMRTLTAGATLVIAPDAALRDVTGLSGICQNASVSHLSGPPTLLKLLDPGAFPTITHVIAGGEQCPDDLARRWTRCGRKFFNGYGPTEVTVFATVDVAGSAQLTIGRPLPNTHLLVVDAHGEPVPSGALGELCVGGVGVTPGYIGLPHLDHDRFLELVDPALPVQRYYRTGDFARIGDDGRVRCYGRTDEQLSIRGYRVEPAEVELALKSAPDIEDAAIAIRRVADMDRLVAFVLPSSGTTLNIQALRDYMQATVPAHLRPSYYVSIEKIPRTQSGKTDRRRLPKFTTPVTSTGTAEPADEVECWIRDLWHELLPQYSGALDEDLFYAGGDSLVSIRMTARLASRFDTQLCVDDIINAGTVADIAALVRMRRRAEGNSHLQPLARADTYCVTAAQQRLWIREQRHGADPGDNIVGAFRMHGPLDQQALVDALNALVARHEPLRTGMTESRGLPRQFILPPGTFPIRLDPSPVERKNLMSAMRVFANTVLPLGQPPLWQCKLFVVAPDEHVLQFSIHHLIADGWSLEILGADLHRAYLAVTMGQKPDLGSRPVQFKEYAEWQAKWLASDDSAAAFWKDQLDGASFKVPVPYDLRPESIPDASVAGLAERDLGRGFSVRLAKRCAKLHVSEYSAALTAAYQIIAEETGTTDIVFGSPFNGRTMDELADEVGYFVNHIPLRLELAGLDAESAVKIAFQTIMRSLAHQHYPIDRMFEHVDGASGAGEAIFDIGFTWNVTHMQAEHDSHLKIVPLPMFEIRANAPLWFYGARKPNGVTFALAYDRSHYSSARADDLLDRVVDWLRLFVQEIPEPSKSRPTNSASPPDLLFDK